MEELNGDGEEEHHSDDHDFDSRSEISTNGDGSYSATDDGSINEGIMADEFENESGETTSDDESDHSIDEANDDDVDGEHPHDNVAFPRRTLFQGVENNVGYNIPVENKDHVTGMHYLQVTLAKSVRHHSTYEHIIDDLKCIKNDSSHINIPTTKNSLWKALGRDKRNLICRIYCDECQEEIGIGKKPTRVCSCGQCGPGLPLTHVGNFIQVRLHPQIREILEMPNMIEKLRYKENRIKRNANAMEDIYDGQEYKRLSLPGNFLSNPYNFSLTLWTDGIKLTKSSKATTYPIILHINELSPHARKRYLLLAGVWVGNASPCLSQVLKHICVDLNTLYEDGISWFPDGREEVQSKFITTIFTADSVARPNVLRMKQYNGTYGCTFCLAPGEHHDSRRVYREQNAILRTDESIRQNGRQAIESRQEIYGVKGYTALATLPQFHLIKGVVIDSLHNSFLGVTKQLLIMFMEDSQEPWYIGSPEKLSRIDAILIKIKTPTRLSRCPRSIKLYKNWKGSEWRNWLFYYALPCLYNILPDEYFYHLALFAEAIFILNNSCITDEDFERAKYLLQLFHADFENKYGLVNMSFNVHLLSHVTESVRNWGPFWAYSTFPFESFNQKITAAITSPYCRADQIVTRFFMRNFITVAANNFEISPNTQDEIKRILKISKHNVPEGMIEGQYFVGVETVGRIRRLEEREIILMQLAGMNVNRNTFVTNYQKAIIHGVEYQLAANVNRKFCNSIVYYQGGYLSITKIFSYQDGENIIGGIIGKQFRTIRRGAFNTFYIHHVESTDDIVFTSYKNVIAPAIKIEKQEDVYIIHLSSCVETD